MIRSQVHKPGQATFVGLLCCLLAAMLAACGGSSTTSTGNQHVTLVVWQQDATSLSAPGADGDYLRYIVNTFEKLHPGVTVKLENHGWDTTLNQNLQTAILGGTAPDVTSGEAQFQQFAALGQLAPLDSTIADVKDQLFPIYKESAYNGHIYALSAYSSIFGFQYNCNVLKEAGYSCTNLPTTWQALQSEAQGITQKGAGNYYGYTLQGPAGYSLGSVFRLAVYLSQAGATLCKNNCTQPYFNDPKSIPVYEFLRELNKSTPLV